VSVFLERPAAVKRPPMLLWGGLEFLPSVGPQAPYTLGYVVENRSRDEIRNAEWKQIQRRVNKDRPEREVGFGWHLYRCPRLRRTLADGEWLECVDQVGSVMGHKGEVLLYFRRAS